MVRVVVVAPARLAAPGPGASRPRERSGAGDRGSRPPGSPPIAGATSEAGSCGRSTGGFPPAGAAAAPAPGSGPPGRWWERRT